MAVPTTLTAAPPTVVGGAVARPDFVEIYDAHVEFVYRSVRRLGVDAASVEDVVQEIFLVVHRRLVDFEGRSSLKTWVFAIALRVVRDHRRTVRRKRLDARADGAELERLVDDRPAPCEALERVEAARMLDGLLAQLDDDRREVFVLAELEGMSVPEIAEITGVNPNTIHSRLRAARREFEAGVARIRARMAFHERRAHGGRS
ncbi:MAG: RNA polymerase sigma factor [Deltaproteobacteria bacterium]|nr:RNA polymerase sigma factor [Deltaproteobacteria bacterium]